MIIHFYMKKLLFKLSLISSIIVSAQKVITLEYDNKGLEYKGTEIKIKGNSTDEYKFRNISIPTLQVFLPEGKSNATTAMVVCPGGGMRSNAFFHEGIDVAKALNEKGIAAFVLK